MIIFTLRRLLLLLVTLFFLTFIGFSLSYFTPHAPLQGASLWNAWVFWFNGLLWFCADGRHPGRDAGWRDA